MIAKMAPTKTAQAGFKLTFEVIIVHGPRPVGPFIFGDLIHSLVTSRPVVKIIIIYNLTNFKTLSSHSMRKFWRSDCKWLL